MTNTRRKSLISTWSYKAVNGQKGPLVTMKLGSVGMSTSHWYAIVALWFAPGAEEGHGTAQRARTYSTALVSKSDSTHGIQGYGVWNYVRKSGIPRIVIRIGSSAQ